MRAIAILSVVVALGALSIAGPLTPPAGPVAPTMKTLDAVEPRIAVNSVNTPGDATTRFLIDEPGSYYLTGDLLGAPGKSGITITARNVTLDLMGFRMQGGSGTLDGIRMADSTQSVVVRNGSVTEWGGKGVQVLTIDGDGAIEDISAVGNGGTGISGVRVRIARCSAIGNGQTGVPIDGIRLLGSGSLIDCTSSNNSGNGFRLAENSVATRCVATENELDGFRSITPGGVSLQSCVSDDNSGDGYNLDERSQAVHCIARENSGSGFVVSEACSVLDCLSTNNNIAQILVEGVRCLIRGNHCEGSSGSAAGIQLDAGQSRIEDNTCVGCLYGYRVTSSASIFLRNSAHFASIENWSIPIGNFAHVVKVLSTPAVNGDSGGAVLTTDPNANLAY